MNFKFTELIKGILIIGSYFILQIVLTIPFVFLLKETNTLYLFVFLGLAIIYLTFYKDTLLDNLKDFKRNYKKILKTTIKYWIIGLGIMIISSSIISSFKIPTSINQDINVELFKSGPIRQSICAIILAPIIEELVFRNSFKKFTNNPMIFALTTGLLFGLIHITSSINSAKDLIMLIHLIPYSAVGIAFGYAYKKNNDNIIGTMIVHGLHNTIAVLEILILL